ncbi:hypothetical protein EAN89_28055 [Klebsiella pneumoniae]|nr:hypothetical protein EAN89_28055 [Klebsiella pneumoniae]
MQWFDECRQTKGDSYFLLRWPFPVKLILKICSFVQTKTVSGEFSMLALNEAGKISIQHRFLQPESNNAMKPNEL